MEAHAGDLTGIALVVSVAVISGLVLTALRQPPLVGYVLAGVVLGPGGFGVISDDTSIERFADLGVLMLLFVLGMELSLRAFVATLRTALLCTAVQIAVALGIGFALAAAFGRSHEQALLLGFMTALSSTAVAVKVLDDIGELRTAVGQVAVGVLIAQDLAAVPMLIVIDALGGDGEVDIWLGFKVAVAVAIVAALIVFFSRRQRVTLPATAWLRGKRDLVPPAALAFCFTAAAVSGVAGLSPAYGAFVAGLVIGNSTDRAVAVRASRPIENVLMILFFLSVGLLLDLRLILDNLGLVLTWLLAVTLVKTVVNVGTLHLLGEPWQRAFPAGVAMGQVGEFSFVLAAAGVTAGILDGTSYRLAIAVIALSLLISPLWLVSARRFHDVAAHGVAGLGAALGQVYAGEITALGRISLALRLTGRAVLTALRRAVAWLLALVRRRPA
jgi:CPA2 family monovalent cation:H+ antiporter-2